MTETDATPPTGRARIDRTLDDLRRLRDRTRVKLHLGAMEAQDLWDELEVRWDDLQAKTVALRRESDEAFDDVQEAALLLIDELRSGYERLRRLL